MTKQTTSSTTKIHWGQSAPFLLVHLIPLGAIWSGVGWASVLLCIALYWVRMFGVTAGYHRYFSHRSFKTSRAFQLVLALLAQSSAQKGVLWWASHHRHHHRFSDMPQDVHSPKQSGFWYSHVLWFLQENEETAIHRVRDLAKYPELRWLDKHYVITTILLGILCFAFFGWDGFFIGFGVSTVLLWHGTFTINSLSHIFGTRRYETTDDSKNNWLLAIITMGEGWHNNHHHYMFSVRQGFYWWEIDSTYYILKALSFCGIVWDLKQPPKEVYEIVPSSEELAPAE